MAPPGHAGNDLTSILHNVSSGDPEAMNHLLDAVYADLHRMCVNRIDGRPAGNPLEPTELVHEVYLRLIDQSRVNWQNRAQFFAVAARLIRRILIDQARAALRQKRGGGLKRVPFTTTFPGDEGRHIDLIALEEALTDLADVNETTVRIVEMRFFAGQTHQEIAHVLQLSERSIRRHWTFAKAWLFRRIGEDRDIDQTDST